MHERTTNRTNLELKLCLLGQLPHQGRTTNRTNLELKLHNASIYHKC